MLTQEERELLQRFHASSDGLAIESLANSKEIVRILEAKGFLRPLSEMGKGVYAYQITPEGIRALENK